MGIDELIRDGFVERSYVRTPTGAAYSEGHFFDENWNYVKKNDAIYLVVKEFNDKREQINEIVMACESLDRGRQR